MMGNIAMLGRHLLIALFLSSMALAQSFDKPLNTQVVDLGPSPDLVGIPNAPHLELSCFLFPGFLVKQEYTKGDKDTDRITIEPRHGVVPLCIRSAKDGKEVIEKPGWNGYFFWGVKGVAVFFVASDGANGTIPFVVFDSRTWKKTFEDSTYDSVEKTSTDPFNHLRVVETSDGNVRLTYLRGAEADCDLPLKGVSCWEHIRKRFRLAQTNMPTCTGYKEVDQKYRPWVSAIVYPVEVVLFPRPVTFTMAGPVKCWPVD